MSRNISFWFLVFSLLFASSFSRQVSAQEMSRSARYSATAIGTRGFVGADTIRLDFIVDAWTTDEEMAEFGNILRERGRDALLSRLERVNIGKVSPTGRVGSNIVIARRVDVGDGQQKIRIVTRRDMPFFELYYSGRSIDYPYSVFDFTLDADGRAKKGGIVVAAKIQFDEQDRLEIVTYGLEPLELRNIKRVR